MHAILSLIKDTYPLRTCNLALTRQNIDAGKFKVCLEYQLGNCKGPCQNYQTEGDYDHNIEEITNILNGKIGAVLRTMKAEMDDVEPPQLARSGSFNPHDSSAGSKSSSWQ